MTMKRLLLVAALLLPACQASMPAPSGPSFVMMPEQGAVVTPTASTVDVRVLRFNAPTGVQLFRYTAVFSADGKQIDKTEGPLSVPVMLPPGTPMADPIATLTLPLVTDKVRAYGSDQGKSVAIDCELVVTGAEETGTPINLSTSIPLRFD